MLVIAFPLQCDLYSDRLVSAEYERISKEYFSLVAASFYRVFLPCRFGTRLGVLFCFQINYVRLVTVCHRRSSCRLPFPKTNRFPICAFHCSLWFTGVAKRSANFSPPTRLRYRSASSGRHVVRRSLRRIGAHRQKYIYIFFGNNPRKFPPPSIPRFIYSVRVSRSAIPEAVSRFPSAVAAQVVRQWRDPANVLIFF